MRYVLVDNKTDKEPIYKTIVDIEIKDENIIFEFYAYSGGMYCPYSGVFNGEHWKGDVCEIFLGQRDYYYEFEVAPDESCMIALIREINEKNLKL